MRQDGIKALFIQDVIKNLGYIVNSTSSFPKYRTYPLDAQLALLDMVFNRGIGTVRSDEPTFIEAIQNRDWKRAAKISGDVGTPSDTRQKEVEKLFSNAAKKEPYFINPGCGRKSILNLRLK